MKIFSRAVCAFLLIFSVFWLFPASAAQRDLRLPAVAGSFYPADPKELGALVEGFLKEVPGTDSHEGELVALIVPHAGYIFSGKVAAHAYQSLIGRQFDTVILLGPCHRMFFLGASVWNSGSWRTPLGDVPVDSETASAIMSENADFWFSRDAHLTEHSLETQIPFLQKTLKDFKIVPILVSDDSPENTARLARAILKAIRGKKALVIASTDMSHYYPYETARTMDGLALDLIEKKDADGIYDQMQQKKMELCGAAAAGTLLRMAGLIGDTRVQVLKYANSGDVTADRSRVVGYGASLVSRKGPPLSAPPAESPASYDAGRKKELLGIARRTLEEYVRTGKTPEFLTDDPALKENRAVFVTLRKGGLLRGCIGRMSAEQPLYSAVRDMTVESCSTDPRFKPVSAEELALVRIEISVLSPFRRVESSDDIEIDRHGVFLRNGNRSGVFLPKVAQETGWSREEFLSQLCRQKAGLPPDAWKDPDTELYVFTAEDFSEEQFPSSGF